MFRLNFSNTVFVVCRALFLLRLIWLTAQQIFWHILSIYIILFVPHARMPLIRLRQKILYETLKSIFQSSHFYVNYLHRVYTLCCYVLVFALMTGLLPIFERAHFKKTDFGLLNKWTFLSRTLILCAALECEWHTGKLKSDFWFSLILRMWFHNLSNCIGILSLWFILKNERWHANQSEMTRNNFESEPEAIKTPE